ncbi:MAG TPA: HIRAN domain-containing protein [Longimicrobiales bacterium]|nr:HIRAN domain-containing protein [Longimicrobiales bacterium]
MIHRLLPPPLPPELPQRFRATVHGTVFADRADHLDRLRPGDELLLLPDPPVDDDDPGVWVHLPDGDLLGHLPPEIEAWLAPWLLRGGRAEARAVRVSGDDVPSWRRLLIEVACVV